VWGKFSMDSIASCAFGVDAESFTNSNSNFVKNAMEVFKFSIAKIIGLQVVPGLYTVMQFFDISVIPYKETQFFVDIIKKTLKTRMDSKTRRNDLIDMMIDAIKSDGIEVDENANEENQYDKDMKLNHSNKIKKLDEIVIIGTAMTLMVAGYDTTGMLLSYIGWELAKNPDIQAKLQEEIDEAFDENNDKMPDYNTIQNLPYLDQVIHEGLQHLGYPDRSKILPRSREVQPRKLQQGGQSWKKPIHFSHIRPRTQSLYWNEIFSS